MRNLRNLVCGAVLGLGLTLVSGCSKEVEKPIPSYRFLGIVASDSQIPYALPYPEYAIFLENGRNQAFHLIEDIESLDKKINVGDRILIEIPQKRFPVNGEDVFFDAIKREDGSIEIKPYHIKRINGKDTCYLKKDKR